MSQKVFLRLPDIHALLGLSKSTIYRNIREGIFPLPVRLGKRAVGWRVDDIDKWVATRKETTIQGVDL